MTLVWLRTFLAVADRGGFSAASEQIHRSQSRVSAHIAALERQTGTTLIDRSRRPAALTYAGEVLARHARAILASVDAARSAVAALRDLDLGKITVVTTPCVGVSFLPEVMAEIVARFPDAAFEVIEHSSVDLEEQLRSDGVGFAVAPTQACLLTPDIDVQPLWRERIQIIVPGGHPLSELGRDVRPADLADHRLVVPGQLPGGPSEIAQLLTRCGLTGSIAGSVQNAKTVVALVRAGLGVGVLNAVATAASPVPGIVTLGFDEPYAVREVSAYWHEVLLGTDIGRTLLKIVLGAPLPPGAERISGAAGV